MSARSYTELVNLARLGMRSVIEMVRGNRNADLGMIHEVSQHMRAQRSPNLPDPMGFCLPWEALTRAGLDSVTTAKGAELHQTNPVGVETVMSVSPVLRRAKAMRALFSPQTIPVEVSGATASHVAENPGSDVSITEMTLSGVSAVMRTAIVATQATLQLRRVSLGASDDAILGDIRKVLALAMENKAINGSGTNEPLGIVSNTAIGTTTLGTNGATIGGADLAELVRSVEDADLTDVELSGAFVTNPKQRKVLSITERAAGSGYMIGASGLVLDQWPLAVTPRVPSNLTKGTATTICSALIFGAWDQLIIADFLGGFEILIDPYTRAAQAATRVVGSAYYDVVPARAGAFQKIVDAR